jgi:hypothetical protein
LKHSWEARQHLCLQSSILFKIHSKKQPVKSVLNNIPIDEHCSIV